jgi:hypothetical protein
MYNMSDRPYVIEIIKKLQSVDQNELVNTNKTSAESLVSIIRASTMLHGKYAKKSFY